jgi:cell division protein FtsB
MITRQHTNTVFRRLWMPLVTAGFLGYFGFHAYHGSFGLRAMDRLEAEAARLTVERDRLRDRRQHLETRVATVRPESLDADVVDLEARGALNLMREDEVVIRLGAAQQSPE